MSDKVALLSFIEAKLFAYQLPFTAPISFKQRQLYYREGLILQLTGENGEHHFTEASPLPGFSHETFTQVKVEMIRLLAEMYQTKQINFKTHISDYHSVQFALDALQLSLDATIKIQNLSSGMGIDGVDNVALLQGSTNEILSQYISFGKPNLIKLKVAREAVNIDINNFQQLCQLNSALQIRCDANQAWNEQQASQFFSAINVKQLDYIEEPTSNHQNNLQLAEKFLIHLGLDETLQQPNFNYQHHQSIRAFIIKPTLIGSKHKIDKLVSIARQLAIKVSISACFESIVGIQQLKSLAASYLAGPQEKAVELSLGIDTLKYFSGTLLQDGKKIEQDCQQLELLWSTRK